MNDEHNSNRRTVLKTIGAGVVGSTILTGTATGHDGHTGGDGESAKGNNYGNGNGIGAWLNEEAMFKKSPVWDTGVADRTGQDEVEILFGGLTDVLHPNEDGELVEVQGPWGMEPRAVKVSPGTAVTWTWYDGPGAIKAHHLVSYHDPPYEEEFELPFGEHDHTDGHEHPGGEDEFYVHEDLGDSFTYTYDEPGTYLNFCIPHATPFSFQFPELGEVSNLFGQRGAVMVVDK